MFFTIFKIFWCTFKVFVLTGTSQNLQKATVWSTRLINFAKWHLDKKWQAVGLLFTTWLSRLQKTFHEKVFQSCSMNYFQSYYIEKFLTFFKILVSFQNFIWSVIFIFFHQWCQLFNKKTNWIFFWWLLSNYGIASAFISQNFDQIQCHA